MVREKENLGSYENGWMAMDFENNVKKLRGRNRKDFPTAPEEIF
jgi:hypothetical protein